MSQLFQEGASKISPGRAFFTGSGVDQVWYEWRTAPGKWDYYELWKVPGYVPLAIFFRNPQDSAVGHTWAQFSYSFVDPDLLGLAILALCVCRAMDGH